jgi:hypothetical protein
VNPGDLSLAHQLDAIEAAACSDLFVAVPAGEA